MRGNQPEPLSRNRFGRSDVYVTINLENLIGFDVEDLSPRSVGSWHEHELGTVRPNLGWPVNILQ